MISVGSERDSLVRTFAGSYIALTDEQKKAIKSEIESDPAGRGYKDLSTGEQYRLFCSEYSMDNPEPQGRVALEYVEADLILNALNNHVYEMEGQIPIGSWTVMEEDAKTSKAVRQAVKAINDYAKIKSPLRLSNPGVAMNMGLVVAWGYLTQEELDYWTTKPDPAWQATVIACRSDIVLGGGYIPDLTEFAEALA